MGWLAKIRVFLIIIAAFVIITLAVTFSVLRAILPHATGYRAEVTQALEEQLGLPVKIDSLDADMSWLQPQLKLLNVRIYNADGKSVLVAFDEVTFSLSYLDSLRFMSPMIGGISLSGGDLSIERDKQGHWFVQGIPIATDADKEVSEKLVDQINNTNFSLLGSTLHLRDETHVFNNMDFSNVNIQVENLLGTHDIRASVDLPELYGKSLQLEAKLEGDLSKPETTDAEIYIKGQSLELKPIFDEFGKKDIISARGLANTEVWLTVKNKQVKQLKTRTGFTQLKVESADHKKFWKADSVSGSAFWQRYSDAWRLDINNFSITRNGNSWARPAAFLLRENAAAGYQVAASYMRLEDLTGLVPLLIGSHYPEESGKAAALDLRGDVYNVNLVLPAEDSSQGAFNKLNLSTVFNDLSFKLPEQKISLEGIDGQLHYKDGQAQIVLASNNVTVEMATLFSQPIKLQSLDASVQATLNKYDWTINADSVDVKNADIATRSRIHMVWPENGKLYLDMQTDFHNGNGASVTKYYPTGIMPRPLVSWLTNSLSGGQVDSGSFIFSGNVSDFPFEQNQGVMETQFRVSDVSLRFLPDWPALNDVRGRVRFYDNSLQVENASAQVYDSDLHNVNLNIDDLQNIKIVVDGKVAATASDAQKYIWNSGLNSVLGDAMRQLPLTGDIGIDLNLTIPLDEKNVAVKTSGTVKFNEDVLDLPSMGYQLTALNGELGFTEQSITADALSARFENAPVSISATTADSPHKESVVRIKGRLPIDGLLRKFDWLPDTWLSGQSDWDVSVHVPLTKDQHLWVAASSPLQGVSIAISDGLHKPAADELPLQFTLESLDDGLKLEFKSKDIFDVLAARDTQQHWKLLIDAPWLKGNAGFDEGLTTDSVIDMKFDYIDLSSLVKPQRTGKLYVKDRGSDAGLGLKPGLLPALNFHADKLDWNAWKFTNVSLNSQHDSDGMRINNLVVHSRALTVTGNGTWLSIWQYPNETHLKLKVHSEHMGDALTGLGYAGTFDHGDLDANIDWYWPAEPYRFSLDTLEGDAEFKLKKGQLLKVNPGTGGRLLGLLNVLQLPQRLLLNFSDVYKDGLVFDNITGVLAFSGGNVTTSNVKIEAASANIGINGRVGLVNEDYDLKMVVKPNSSAAAFTGGTLYGGPIVGAGLVLLEKLLGIDKLTQDRYTITGKWDKPVITQISKGEKVDKVNKNEEN